MGATASVNAASKKYKPSEPIEVKFHNVVKYDDGDEKPFRDGYQLANRKQQPLTLLTSAIRILERGPKGQPIPNGYLPKQYARQVRPRSAYMVLKNNSKSSSTLSSSNQHGMPPNGLHTKLSPTHKQHKTKQSLYMSLINPASMAVRDPSFPRNGMTVPTRIRPPPHIQISPAQPKSNTLPRSYHNGARRLKVNRKLYMDMIRPVMASPQYVKLGGNRAILATPSSQRTMSRQSYSNQNLTPRPPNGIHKRLHPNLLQATPQRELYTPKREAHVAQRRAPTPQRSLRSDHSSSVSNGFLPHKELHFPRLARKTRDEVSLNSSSDFTARGQIPKGHPDNVIPLYFRKSLAYSPQYKRKELLSSPL